MTLFREKEIKVKKDKNIVCTLSFIWNIFCTTSGYIYFIKDSRMTNNKDFSSGVYLCFSVLIFNLFFMTDMIRAKL